MHALQAIATVFIGIAGLTIAYQQKRLADIRLRHDLFDRRYAVLNAARTVAAIVMREGTVKNEQVFEFLRGSADASFILDDKIASYMNEMKEKAFRLNYVEGIIARHKGDEEYNKAVDASAALCVWFSEQFDILVVKFQPFLQLERKWVLWDSRRGA